MGLSMFGPPEPIEPAYKPRTSITRIPAAAPTEEILEVIERDGGVILTDFATPEDLAAIDRDVEVHRKQTRTTEKKRLADHPQGNTGRAGSRG